MTDIPYTIRISDRAQRARLVIKPHTGLEVVIPRTYNQQQIPQLITQLIAQHTQWITKHLKQSSPPKPLVLPTEINLPAIAQLWQINYQTHSCKPKFGGINDRQILIIGTLENQAEILEILKQWLILQAKQYLPQLLRKISILTHLPYRQTTVRSQKTIWASCSRNKDISLNYKLLCLPSELMNYVFIHELCHTKYMHHRQTFWELVATYDPHYKQHELALNSPHAYLPSWL